MKVLIKGFLDKILKATQNTNQEEVKPISHEEVEALVEAKIKEHAATLEVTKKDGSDKDQSDHQEDKKLSPKQIDFALSLIDKVSNEFVLAIAPAELTVDDLNKLISHNRYKNKGILVNLVKKGVLKRK